MRRILALDTSTWWGSVALVEREADAPARVVAERGERVEGSHAESLMDWIERLLADCGWSKTSLDAYAATCGPGSFTGIRVGLGTIRGLGLATGRPCLGVTTLHAIAHASGPGARDRFPVLDAGRGELYAARYDAASSPPVVLEEPWLDAASSVLAHAAGGLVISGPGTAVDAACVRRSPERLAGAAGCVATSADTARPLAPLYIRPPDALLHRKRG